MRIKLSTGVEITDHLSIDGDPEDGADGCLVTYGYDGPCHELYESKDEWGGLKEAVSPEDKRTIAEHMIAKWKAWAGL